MGIYGQGVGEAMNDDELTVGVYLIEKTNWNLTKDPIRMEPEFIIPMLIKATAHLIRDVERLEAAMLKTNPAAFD